MAARFLLRLLSENETEWVRQSDDGENQLLHSRGSLAEAAKEAAGCRVIVLLPASEVLFTSVKVPSRQRQHIISAVPYALEDQLADDIDDLHFAIGERNDDGSINVVIIDAAVLAGHIGILRHGGLDPQVIIPESLALPCTERTWSVLYFPERILVRTAWQQGFSIEAGNVPDVFPRLYDSDIYSRPDLLNVYNCSGTFPELGLTGETEIREVTVAEPPLMFMARHYTEDRVLNLIQGRFSRREQLGKIFRPWRAAAILLAILLVVNGGMSIADYYSLRSQNRTMSEQIEQVFRDTFPGQKVEDARAQMAINLKMLKSGGGAGHGFIPVLAIAGPVLRGTESVELQHLAYRDGRLDVALTIRDLQLLDKLKQSLAGDGVIDVAIGSATTRDNIVEAQLTLQQAGP